MSRFGTVRRAAALLLFAAGALTLHAQTQDRQITLAVVMTNDSNENAIQAYDAATGALLQTLSTFGKGGVGGNGGGVKQFDGKIVAAVNNGSNTVAVFKRLGNILQFDRLVTTTSAPVSVDFGNGHMYVAGTTTVDSFVIHGNNVDWLDGTTQLEMAGGGAPPEGSTAQVGAIGNDRLLVTLKNDPEPGTVDVIELRDGVITGAAPTAVPGPAGSLAPFGFSVYPDGTALITLAHSAQNGLFRNGEFKAVIDTGGQAGPCWTTRVGKYVFVVNTGSQTISRLVGTGNNLFIDDVTAASIATGNPTDADANDGILAVIDHGAGQSHLSLFTYDQFGELTSSGIPVTLGVANANGVAILPKGKA